MLFGLVIARGKIIVKWNYFILPHGWHDENPLKIFCEKWLVILQLFSELSILRQERRFKLQKILSDASIKNEVVNHIKVNDMHWNGVSPLPEPWPSSWTHVCLIGLQCYLSIIVVETIIKGHTWERQRIEKLLDSGATKDTPI